MSQRVGGRYAVVRGVDLARRVGEREARRGDELQRVPRQAGAERGRTEVVGRHRHVRPGVGAGHVVEDRAVDLGRGRPATGRERDRLDGIDRGAVPVQVEPGVQLGHGAAGEHHVEVDEVVLRAAQEVFVGEVAAADDRQRAVSDEQLVVHAVVQPLEVERERERERAAGRRAALGHERVEQAHLDVRRGRQAEQQAVERSAVYRSSTSNRTRTPRVAASRSARSSGRPVESSAIR